MEQAVFFTSNFLIEGVLSNAAYDWLKNLYNKNRNKQPTNLSPLKPEEPPHKSPVYNAVAQRMIDAIELINEGRYEFNYLSHSHIAELMDMKNVSEFENLLTSKETPDFEYLNKFAAFFNINPEWLKHGKEGHPFSHASIHEYMYLQQALIFISEYNPDRIFFVRSLCENSVCCVVLTKSDYDFRILHFHSNWRISAKTGGTGQGQTLSIYKAILNIKQGFYEEQKIGKNSIHNLPSYAKVSGIELTDRQSIYDLIDGKKHPNFLKHSGFNSHSYWYEDLTDIYHKDASAEQYLNMYGPEFIDAQNVIRYKLSEK